MEFPPYYVPSSMSPTISSSHVAPKTGALDTQYSQPSLPLGRPERELTDSDETELVSVSWNQDYGCFAAGTNCGFHLYKCEPFRETIRRELGNGGFQIVEMLFQSNIMALVGTRTNLQCPPNRLLIWDDRTRCIIFQRNFRSEVRSVKLRQDRVVVVLEHMVYVHNFRDYRCLHEIETLSNPKGLCCLSHQADAFVLACPGLRKGHVRIKHFDSEIRAKDVNAHDSDIACLTLTLDGLLLATASMKGTLIRIFNTKDGTCMQEVRRGAERADIYSIAFSPTAQWLVVSSDKGTVHVFRVQASKEDSPKLRSTDQGEVAHQYLLTSYGGSSLSFMKGLLPKYFSSERSLAQFHLPEYARFIAAFGAQNSIQIIGMDGSYYKCTFDPHIGGEMQQQEYIQFLKVKSKKNP